MKNSCLVSVICSLLYLAPSLSASEDNKSNYNHNLSQLEAPSDPTENTSIDGELIVAADKKSQQRSIGLTRTDQIPQGRLQAAKAAYLEGYIQALIDANYYDYSVLVYVNKDGHVYLYNLPIEKRLKDSVLSFIADLPDVKEVHEGVMDDVVKEKLKNIEPIRRIDGVWFPESTVLFPPLIANPREPVYSVAYRWGDKVLAKKQIEISLGDTFPIFRWFNVFPVKGDLQLDIAAGVWSSFNMAPAHHPDHEWAELVNTDYLLSIPLTYAFDAWAFRLRVYHISTHLGDEYIVNHPNVKRRNPSYEALEFISAYQATRGLRVYFGPGFILHSDDSYPMKTLYFDYGLEWRITGLRHHYHQLYGSPFFAIDIEQWQATNYQPSVTAQLGYEWSKMAGAGRKMRLFAEYHNGNSEGQFFKLHTQYIAIRGSWGF